MLLVGALLTQSPDRILVATCGIPFWYAPSRHCGAKRNTDYACGLGGNVFLIQYGGIKVSIGLLYSSLVDLGVIVVTLRQPLVLLPRSMRTGTSGCRLPDPMLWRHEAS